MTWGGYRYPQYQSIPYITSLTLSCSNPRWDITFYKSKDGYLARQKGGTDKERFHYDPNFQRTRENAAEFGNVGKASKALSTAIRPVLDKTKDPRMFSRLVKVMMQVVKSDQMNNRGQRSVLNGDLILLQNIDFNGNARWLTATLYAPYTATIDRVDGILEVEVPSFNPDSQIVAPGGTTRSLFP